MSGLKSKRSLEFGPRGANCPCGLSVLLDELAGVSPPANTTNLRMPAGRPGPPYSEILRLPMLRSARGLAIMHKSARIRGFRSKMRPESPAVTVPGLSGMTARTDRHQTL